MDHKIVKAYFALEALDWSIVEGKLSEIDLKGYTVPDVLREGLRFLAMVGVSKRPVSPSPLVDEVWHLTMLDSVQYVNEVTKIFGHYVHHHPSDGSEETNKRLEKAYWHTIDLYEKTYGDIPIPGIWGLELKKKSGGKR